MTGVRTDRGDVEAETVVLACGLWTRDLAATVGVPVPLYAAEHVHVSTEPIEGAHDLLPLVRGLDGYFYARHHAGGLMIGAFEPDGRPRSTGSIPDDWAFGEFGPDWEHFAPDPRERGAAHPGTARRGVHAVPARAGVLHPRRRTSASARPPRSANLFVAAGFNSQGIIYSPGAGRALAEWIREGAPTFDASEVDVRRFAASQANERYLHERTKEALGRLYAMHWPNLQATHGAWHPAFPALRPPGGRGRVLRRARAVGARRSGSRRRASSPPTTTPSGGRTGSRTRPRSIAPRGRRWRSST